MLLADAGVPMIVYFWPPAILILIPVILLEAWIGKRILNVPFSRCAKGAAVANLISTLVGIPLAWIALATLEGITGNGGALGLNTFGQRLYAVTVQSPWLIPYGNDLNWMAPIATVVLAIPFYLVSVVSETVIAKWFFSDRPPKDIWRWMWWANAASYALLIILIVGGMFLSFPGQVIGFVSQACSSLLEAMMNLVFYLAQLFIKKA